MAKVFLSMLLAGMVVCSTGAALAQTVPSEQRIAQAIIVNGQQVQGVTVIENGTVRTFTCPSPQEYFLADQSSSGWACFDQATGTWLMNAVPPQTATVYDQPPVYQYYGSPYYYYPYGYGFGYYGYPAFQFGFGFGYGHHGHGYYLPHEHFRGHEHFGGQHFAGPGHGSFGHAFGGHAFGRHMGGGHR